MKKNTKKHGSLCTLALLFVSQAHWWDESVRDLRIAASAFSVDGEPNPHVCFNGQMETIRAIALLLI